LAFPSVAERHHWIEEGTATYVEPIARVQAGILDPSKMWSDLIRDLPQGLPKPGDQGLDVTHTWGRTYWGGALFCLLADLEIHERTHNRKGLEDALRGILAAGGNITEDWPLERALRVGDEATGTRVLEDLYEEMKDKPVMFNLPSLWRRLGIQRLRMATFLSPMMPHWLWCANPLPLVLIHREGPRCQKAPHRTLGPCRPACKFRKGQSHYETGSGPAIFHD
jgi:hypothetical protein